VIIPCRESRDSATEQTMFFRMMYDDKLAQAAYLIGCQRTGEAIVFDPERDVDRYLKIAAAEKLRIVAVAETHIHADFLSGTRELAERIGAKVYVSDEGDDDWKYQWLTPGTPALRAGSADGSSESIIPGSENRGTRKYDHQLLKHDDVFHVGHIEFKVIHTPGHTPEHICFLVTDQGGGATEPMGAITGDFVFVGDLGRPDLLETAAGMAGVKEASARSLYQSARQFMKWPDFLQVWPAHGAGSACGKSLGAVPQSTAGYEKRFNQSLLAADDEKHFVQTILEGQPEPPLYFGRMKRQNKNGPKLLGEIPKPFEMTADDLKNLDAKTHAILDARPWPTFRGGHLAGALHIPFGNQFPTLAGSFIDEDEPIVLICERFQVDEAVRCLIRVGLDNVRRFATPQTLEAAASAGLKLTSTREIDARTFMQEMKKSNAFVLDVRRASEHEAGHVPDSLNIAHTRLRNHLDELPRDRPILVHCQGGTRSAFATALLERHGFNATNIAGGFGAYEKAGGEVARETANVR
jgi:hydroxyacylglutathione hydrolase